jgi:hypothetical protein
MYRGKHLPKIRHFFNSNRAMRCLHFLSGTIEILMSMGGTTAVDGSAAPFHVCVVEKLICEKMISLNAFFLQTETVSRVFALLRKG